MAIETRTMDYTTAGLNELLGKVPGLETGLTMITGTTGTAPAFSSASSYTRGEIVTYGNLTYECNVGTFSGEWVASSWKVTTIAAELIKARDKVNYLYPATGGTSGQVLTIGEDGNTLWREPGGVETVTIQLSVESGTGVTSGVSVSVQVEGENNPRVLTTDANGRAVTRVAFGLQYTVSFNNITGYLPVASLVYRSALISRLVTGVYREDASATVEHVVVTIAYTTGSARASVVNVQTDTGTTSYPIVNNQCEFDVPLGMNYTIKFAAVDGYTTPYDQTYTAVFNLRWTKGYYIGSVVGLSWVEAATGDLLPFDAITKENAPGIVGLRIAPDSLAQEQATFVVPLEYLIAGNVMSGSTIIVTAKTIGSKTWGPSVLLENLPCYTSAQAATTPDAFHNFDGKNNTEVYLDEAATKQLAAMPAFTACTSVTYSIGGVSKTGFLGSYMQMKVFSDNRANINVAIGAALGVSAINVSSGLWWSSTQCSAAYAVILNYGGFNASGKYNDYGVVPFLAY